MPDSHDSYKEALSELMMRTVDILNEYQKKCNSLSNSCNYYKKELEKLRQRHTLYQSLEKKTKAKHNKSKLNSK